MLIVMKLAPFVEMILLKRGFATSIYAVGVATSPGKSILSTPTVNIVLFLSFFSGHTLQTNCHYVTSFLRSFGIYFCMMNAIVSVRFFIRPPTPLASLPNLFAEDVIQFFLNFGFIMSCL